MTNQAASVAAAAAAPISRPEDIHRIVETVDRYNPQNIPVLEAYVDEHLASPSYATAPYDRDACLAVLKLYQFNPAFCNTKIICSILQLALGALPDSDFGLCLYMLNEEVLKDADVARLVALHDLLQQARFGKFWAAVVRDAETAALLVNGEQFAIRARRYIAGTLAIAYRVVAVDALQTALGLKDAKEVDAFLAESEGWKRDPEDKDAVVLPMTRENQPKPVVVAENIKFEHLTKVIGLGRASQ